MKALLRFDLDLFDDRMAHARCVKATDMAASIWDYVNNGRKRVETAIENRMERGVEVSPHEAVQMAFEHFRAVLENNAVNIDDLYL